MTGERDVRRATAREANELTADMLDPASASYWRNASFRAYDVTLSAERAVPGKAHPLSRLIEEVRGAFLSLWTRKEAYLKATGGGLGWGRALADVDVEGGLAGWSVRELTPARGFQAALVVAGEDWRLETWRWRPAGHPSPRGRG